jgi:hypothetical protein
MRRGRPVRLLLTGVGLTLLVLGLAPAGASSANISRSYKGSGSIVNGSIVSLDPQRSDYVQAANTNNGARLLGVAVASNDSLLAVDATAGNIQVATSGNASVLVSDVGGKINVGDQIGVSPFNGVGMKATAGSRVIGLAQTGFDKNTGQASLQSVTDKDGKSNQIAVGFARVTIAIGNNANDAQYENLNGLQRFARSVTGHTVSTTRVVISLVVVVVSLLALITLVYASIYSSIISIGRNPLAKYAVFRTLGSVLGMAALTTLVASVTVYLLLR